MTFSLVLITMLAAKENRERQITHLWEKGSANLMDQFDQDPKYGEKDTIKN